MPILDLQRSLRRLGKIRMGEQRQTKDGKSYPARLETWRLTSSSEELLAAAATLYGGDVRAWEEPKSNDRFELITETDSLDIVLPPGDFAFSQWYEMWSGGGCQRRCDGQTEQLSDGPCLCPPDAEERAKLASKPKPEGCKVTSRLNVILPHVPDIGVWQLETHGYYSAVELPGSLEIIRMASTNGYLVPARLRLEQRSAKREGSTLRYAVPVIELPTLSAGALMTGEAPARPIEAPRPALEAGRTEEAGSTGQSNSGPESPSTAAANSVAPAPRPPAQPPLPGEEGVPARAAAPAKKAAAKKAAAPKAPATRGSYEGGPFDENATGPTESHPWSKPLHIYADAVAQKTGFNADELLAAAVAEVLGDPAKRSTKDLPDQRTANRVTSRLRDVQEETVEVVSDCSDGTERYRIVPKGEAA